MQPLCIYGDLAYPLRLHLQAPYRDAHLMADQEAFLFHLIAPCNDSKAFKKYFDRVLIINALALSV